MILDFLSYSFRPILNMVYACQSVCLFYCSLKDLNTQSTTGVVFSLVRLDPSKCNRCEKGMEEVDSDDSFSSIYLFL